MKEYTVVVPVYNVEKFLCRCIDSILLQTYPPKQIILIDDGSTDGSGEICDDYARKYELVCVVHQKNQGPSAARNKGVEMSKTELITFVDSDDYIDPDMYLVLIKNMIRENAQISICGMWIEKENGYKYPKHKSGSKMVLGKREALISLNSYQTFDMSFCTVMLEKKLFEMPSVLRFPINKRSEDYFLMHQVIARAETVVYDSDPYYHYFQRPESRSRSVNIDLSPMDASLAQLEFYEKNYPELAYVAETACSFSHMGIYTAYVRNGKECPRNLLKKLKLVCRSYLISVTKNPHIPAIKKIQALSFCFALPVYKFVIGRTEHR